MGLNNDHEKKMDIQPLEENSDDNKNDETKYLDIDEFLDLIGPFNKAQMLMVTMFCIIIIPSVYQTLIMSFAGNSPPWKCSGKNAECNSTKIYTIADKSLFTKRCSMSRESWEFTKPSEYSIVTEWDLVCSHKEKSYLANSAMFVGWAIGAVVLGWVSDRYGRKIVLFPSILMVILSGFASAFVPEFWIFFTLRLIIGIFQGGVKLTSFVMASELVGPKYRSISATQQWFAFTFALCLMGMTAWLVPKWRMLEIILTIPYIFILVFYRFIPESVRWYRVNNKLEEAENVLKKIAKVNKKPWPNAKLTAPPNLGEVRTTVKDVFVPFSMGLGTAIQCFTWFVNGAVYYGISLASDNLGGDMYRDFVLTSLVEIPGNILVIVGTDKIGRKPTVIYGMILAGLSCVGVAFVPNVVSNEVYKWIRVSLGMLGKLCITCSFNAFYVWSVELYPTTVRSQGMGVLSVVSRIGAACAPWVAQFLGHIHHMLPFSVMGGSALISAITLCYLKETHGMATAETLGDAAGSKNAVDDESILKTEYADNHLTTKF